MKIQTSQQWDERWKDTTKFFFVILGGGQEALYTSAENQSSREVARETLWVTDLRVLPEARKDLAEGDSSIVACTVCLKRHVTKRFKNSDFPVAVMDSRIDDAFGEAAEHDEGKG